MGEVTMSNRIRQVFILVGGRGTRLGNITNHVPKPLLIIANERPFLDYIIECVARHGYEEIFLLAGHHGDQIEKKYSGRVLLKSHIKVVRERSTLGTGGALSLIKDIADERFIVMNGDALFDINLLALEQVASYNEGLATLALRDVADGNRYGRVSLEEGRITAFAEKDSSQRGPVTINGGIYVLDRRIFDFLYKLPCSIEQDIFPVLVENKAIFGEKFNNYFLDIGLPETLSQAHLELPNTRSRPAVFLDRDGVINEDSGYTHKVEDLKLVCGASEVIRRFNDCGYYVFVVTNQSGVARGFYELSDVEVFNNKIQEMLALYGAHVDKFYVSPYHPDGSVVNYSIEHYDRKPNPGMIIRAMAEWPVISERSFLIGDKESDIEAARRAGIKGYLFNEPDLRMFVDKQII